MTTDVQSHDTENKENQEDWLQKRWRPLMAGMYLVVCTCDFVIFPVLWGILQILGHGRVETQWSPITLNGAGLFHMSMGAILGIAAWGRTQEKMAGVAANPTPSFGSPTPSAVNTPAPVVSAPVAPTAPSFSAPAPSFGTPAPSFGSKPTGPAPFTPPAL
jgi:hypothetical protein